jgi:DMSO/TMAO reductase YedYZ molybdopterin-dependent catalytic subunit
MPLAARKVVVAEPENSETPLDAVHGWVTPRQYFFVRNHFNVPAIDPLDYRLAVEGLVHSPAWWSLEELSVYPQRTVFATVECAGNGRSFLAQKAAGVQWGAGAIGHAEWTGVPLRLILERAGLKPGVTEILFEGADRGSESDHPEPMHFARSLPLEKAMHPDTLLATHMNGEPLEPSHGAPLRLFVPGWYGVASVKWLTRIEAIDYAFKGYFQTTKYTVSRQSGGGVQSVIVGPMAVKSEIIRPRAGEALGIGINRIFGLAWAGEDAVASVEISVDGGATWHAVPLSGPQADYSWRLWEYPWHVQKPGRYTILARATSTRGQVQPMGHDTLNGGYLVNFSRPTPVDVKPARVEDDLSDPSSWQYDLRAFSQQNASVPLDVMMEMDLTAGAGI